MTWPISEFMCTLNGPLVEVPSTDVFKAKRRGLSICNSCVFNSDGPHDCQQIPCNSPVSIIYMRRIDAVTFKLTGLLPEEPS